MTRKKCLNCGVMIADAFKHQLYCCKGCRLDAERRKYKDRVYISSSYEAFLKTRFIVFSRDDFRCVYCGRNPQVDGVTLEVEHITPRVKGGVNNIDNYVTACRECNAGKGDILLEKWKMKKILQQNKST